MCQIMLVMGKLVYADLGVSTAVTTWVRNTLGEWMCACVCSCACGCVVEFAGLVSLRGGWVGELAGWVGDKVANRRSQQIWTR